MNQKEMLKSLEEIEKTVKQMIAELRGSQTLTPFQLAIRTVTSKNSTDQQVKDALKLFIQSPEQLTAKQFAFAVFYLAVNKYHLSDDINYFIDIEIGKRKYSQRDNYIDEVVGVLENKYKSNQTLVSSLKIYLSSMKKK